MPFAIPALLSGISGLAGGLNNRAGTTTQTNTGTVNDAGTQSETPTFTPQQTQLSNDVVGGYESQLNTDPNLSGYEASGLSQINSGNDARQKAVGNILASRGLSFSPAAAATLGSAKNAGIDQSVNFANSIPLLAQQIKMAKLQQAGGFFNNMAHGQTGQFNNTRTLNTTSKTTTPGNILGGALSGAGGMLAYLYGKGAFGGGGGNNNSGASLIPGLFGGGGSNNDPSEVINNNGLYPGESLPTNDWGGSGTNLGDFGLGGGN